MYAMPNNLEAMIRRSGLAKKQVAAAKGVTPETLSRHIHGKIQMTLQDAEAYAKLLDCTAQEVLFPTKPLSVIADWRLNEEGQPYLDLDTTHDLVYLSDFYEADVACVRASLNGDVPWQFEMWNGQLDVIDYRPALKGTVSKECFQQPSYAMTPDGELWWGLIYPEPGGTYTIHANTAPGFNNASGLKLLWACPVISIIRRPDLRGVQIVSAK